MTRRFVRTILAGLLAVASSCGPIDLPDGERKQVVREIAANVVLPSLDDLDAKTDALAAAGAQFAAAPTPEGLDATQQAWRDARAAWKEAGAFLLGPAVDLHTSNAVDWPDIAAKNVETEVAGTAELTDAYVDALGTSRKGFHAIEYMLFDASGDDAMILAAMTASPSGERRRSFLVALAAHVHRRAVELRDAWAGAGSGYFERFTQPGRSDSAFATVKGVLDGIVNESVLVSEIVADSRLGKPLGTGAGGVAQPYLEESALSDNSVADMLGNLRGIRNVYLGTRTGASGKGITTLIAPKSPSTDIAVKRAVDDAIQKVEAIPLPYRTALVEQRATVQGAYDAVKVLKRLLAADVVAALGASLNPFNGNDGD